MSRFPAKRIQLSVMKECTCGTFTMEGYYIQYRSNSTDTLLFVCDCCYEQKFKNRCYADEFDETDYIRKHQERRYTGSSVTWVKFVRKINHYVKIVRKVMIMALMSIMIVVGILGNYSFSVPELRFGIRSHVTNAQFHLRVCDEINFHIQGKIKNIIGIEHQINKVVEQLHKNVSQIGGEK